MILSNVAIHQAIDDGDFCIEPEPSRFPTLEVPDCQYDTSSLNLRLAPDLSIGRTQLPLLVDLRQGGVAALLSRIYDPETISSSGYKLEPGTFILGRTIEFLKFPIREEGRSLAARVEGRSSFARCGMLVHFTAPTVHAGFEGTLTLEILNLGPHPIMLFSGMKICQLILERVEGIPTPARSQFQGQNTAPGMKKD
jgi:dCTP deaminase